MEQDHLPAINLNGRSMRRLNNTDIGIKSSNGTNIVITGLIRSNGIEENGDPLVNLAVNISTESIDKMGDQH